MIWTYALKASFVFIVLDFTVNLLSLFLLIVALLVYYIVVSCVQKVDSELVSFCRVEVLTSRVDRRAAERIVDCRQCGGVHVELQCTRDDTASTAGDCQQSTGTTWCSKGCRNTEVCDVACICFLTCLICCSVEMSTSRASNSAGYVVCIEELYYYYYYYYYVV